MSAIMNSENSLGTHGVLKQENKEELSPSVENMKSRYLRIQMISDSYVQTIAEYLD